LLKIKTILIEKSLGDGDIEALMRARKKATIRRFRRVLSDCVSRLCEMNLTVENIWNFPK
jgi:hypothetical protein